MMLRQKRMIADLEFIIKTVSDFLGGGYEWWGSIKSDVKFFRMEHRMVGSWTSFDVGEN